MFFGTIENMNPELRPIPDFPGYFASDDGRIWSSKRRGRWLKLATHSRYPTATLCVDGKPTTRAVHRLVAEAFHGPLPEGLETCHNDGDPMNNRPDNLRYDTHVENMRDIVRHGRHPGPKKTHCPKGHPYTEANTYRYDGGRRCKACAKTAAQDHYQATYQRKYPGTVGPDIDRLVRKYGNR